MYYLLLISLTIFNGGFALVIKNYTFIHQNGKYLNSYNKITLINSLTPEEEEKLQDLIGKKVSNLSNKELLNEIINVNDPSVTRVMDDIFDIDNLPSLERTETLNSNGDENNDIIDKDFYDPTVGEFKMKYSTEEERINMAKNAVTHILEDNMVLAVPIKKVIVNNGHIDTIFWRDSHKYIEIWIPLKNTISCKDIDITFSTDNVKITNGDSVMLDLPLPGPIRADECVWESVNKSFPELPVEAPQTIHIVLTKRASHEHIWKFLVRK